jgi:release factor glutamine methyltransferase
MDTRSKKRHRRLLEVLNGTAAYLAKKGFENPRLDAELLLGHALGLKRIELYLQFERVLTSAEIAAFKESLQLRLQHTPIQYILGETEFYSLALSVNQAVFIPRPETEILVHSVVQRLEGMGHDVVVADIGTGCGAIAVALAHRIPQATLYATDCCPRALQLAADNVKRHDLEERIVLLRGDLLAPVRDLKDDQSAPLLFDAIVSNPPYVKRGDLDLLPDEIKEHEPRLALDGGPDGLDCYRALASEATDLLKPGGFVALEVADGQADAVEQCLRANSRFGDFERVCDLNGIERLLMAQKVPE